MLDGHMVLFCLLVLCFPAESYQMAKDDAITMTTSVQVPRLKNV